MQPNLFVNGLQPTNNIQRRRNVVSVISSFDVLWLKQEEDFLIRLNDMGLGG
jgi:hypothetical protein